MPMNRAPAARLPRRAAASAPLLAAAGCAQLPPTSAVAIPPIPAGQARLWIYRNDGPYDPQATPYVRLNGQVAGVSEPNGAFYRDVAPGHYLVSVDSYGRDVNQFAEADLTAGQVAYVQVQSLRRQVGGGESGTSRDTFYTRLISVEDGRAVVANTPYYGGSYFSP
jgi:hypothetical protein